MSELVDAVRALGVPFETSDTGNWVRFTCDEGALRYIVRARLADGYLTWCATGDEPTLEWYLHPLEAIRRERQQAVPGGSDRSSMNRDNVYLPFTSGNPRRNLARVS